MMMKAELARKSLHILIALVPVLASINLSGTVLLLFLGLLIYSTAESLRFLGFSLPIISSITRYASRKSEEGRFALGPITLGLGALLSLLLFSPMQAALAIYVLAFADCAAGLIGKFAGKHRPRFLAGKSIEGTLAGFIAAALAGFFVSGDIMIAGVAGIISILVDIIPLGDFDNLILPLAVGLASSVL